MAYTITLTDEEYAALSAAAAERGQSVEALAHEALAERYARSDTGAAPQADPLIAYMLRMGHIRQAPTRMADTPAEQAERQRLAASAAPGKLASEMTLDDRGPRHHFTARELMRMPREERNRILEVAAAEAEVEYRTNPELTAFEALSGEDFFDESPEDE